VARIPRRPASWLADGPRRVRIESGARRAYRDLVYRRCQTRTGPIHTYQAVIGVPGYENRKVTIEFWEAVPDNPRIYADGPSDSKHRFDERRGTRLCIWYPGDPEDRVWVPDDGLLALFGMAAVHLLKEAWWREHGEWIGDEAPHQPDVSIELTA